MLRVQLLMKRLQWRITTIATIITIITIATTIVAIVIVIGIIVVFNVQIGEIGDESRTVTTFSQVHHLGIRMVSG